MAEYTSVKNIMFTGIVQEIGKVKKIEKSAQGLNLEIACDKVLRDKKIGDSIAVNGACLTIVEIGDNNFGFEVITETINKTNLKNLQLNDEVNLEPAMTLNQGIDGHLVQGHIDGEGVVQSLEVGILTIKFPEELSDCLAFKGSITINGVSLTISDLQHDTFSVSLIPHTLTNTNLKNLKNGDTVNLEVDLIARYLKNLLDKKENETKYAFLKDRNLI